MNDVKAQDGIAVHVRLFADLRKFLPHGYDGPLDYRLPIGSTVQDLLSTIGIGAEAEVTAGLKGEQAERDTVLHDGDEIVLFSPMEGGSLTLTLSRRERD